MDLMVLKKRLDLKKSDQGKLTKLDEASVVLFLKLWEDWKESLKEFYTQAGISKSQFYFILKQAKKLEVKSSRSWKEDGSLVQDSPQHLKANETQNAFSEGIVLSWESNKTIQFQSVDQLVEFLKKVA